MNLRAAKNVGIVVFDDVELLDFAGPLEVFSVVGRWEDTKPMAVYTVAESDGLITTRNGCRLCPACTFRNPPQPEVLVVPGGLGTRREMNNPIMVDWVREMAEAAEIVLSVCTGSLILAKAGLLDGLKATTHHLALDLLAEVAPRTEILPRERVIDNGKIITSAGISAGIDAALHVVARLYGDETARQTADYMEYDAAGEILKKEL